MAPERIRQVALLLTLVVVLAGVVTYELRSPPSVATAPASNGRGSGARAGAQTAQAPDVHLPALSAERPKPNPGERNLFRFRPKPPPAPPPAPTPAQPPPSPTATQGPPGPPPITLKFIGVVDPGGGKPKIVSLVDASGHPIVCTEGQTDCDGRYHIWRVGAESIDISYFDGSGRRTIRQTGS